MAVLLLSAHCWLSIAEVCGTQANPLQQLRRVNELAALGAWRYTQGIYRFDPDLLAALVDTPLDGDLPVSAESPGVQAGRDG